MPNGISCAFFAVRNHVYGTKEHNVFKEGIAACQSIRTADAFANSSVTKNLAGFSEVPILSTAAKIAKAIVYPLIVLSGIYKTITSDDKVKTGINQALSILTMYGSETLAEKGLNAIYKKILNQPVLGSNKAVKAAAYAAKGLAFVGASIGGYTLGSKISDTTVDGVRNIIHKHNSEKNTETTKTTDSYNVFDEMNL